MDISPSDAYSLREIIIVAAYVIGGTVGLVLIIAIILTAIQRALLLRQARARVCRDGAGSRRQLVGEHSAQRGGPGSNAAADRPPSYDEVLGSPDQYASRSAANRGANPPLLTTDDVIRPPSYDDALVQNTAAK